MQPEWQGVGGGLRGWRLWVARIFASWSGAVIITAIVLAFLLWVWLFTTSPSERYWQCMDGELRGWKESGAASDFGDVAFILADENCDRPTDISRDEAETEWLRRWDAP